MTLRMPEADGAVLARREKIVAALRQIVPGEGVIAGEREMRPFESDGLTAYRQLPMVVVLPETTEQVATVLRYCHDEGIRVVPRGAGTSLSGGALPLADGVLLGMAKFNRIRARVKPNIVFTDDVPGNPSTEVEVRMAPDGTIVARKIEKASGVKSWDDAVLRALDKTEVLPRDVDGRVHPPLIIVVSLRG